MSPEQADSPTAIGPYLIRETLGEGGMGTVYLAEQRAPVQRRVALKLIKLGMDSKAVVARFEQERQALALMDHEGIAKVFDCGTSERGQPFVVMELVKGVPINQFCEQQQLALADRLQLMQQVCGAVQHAHQKGVVHRDLKPGNVLVADDGGRRQVKIIDFGLAKAVGQKLVEATLFTEAGQVVGTPEYMAPEQADPTNQDIDTRADIYSLGVMLYELLVGELPFTSAELRGAGMLEVQRMLREVDPPKPSTRLTSLGEDASEIARTRRVAVGALRKALKSDLDWVVLKALDKERNRRYETANALSADLQRYLDCEPLTAGPPSTAYRVRKFVRKHRAQVVAAALVLVTLVAGVIGTTWFAFDASEQAEIAAQQTSEVLRLADGERVRDYAAEADRLWPAHPTNIEDMQTWLEKARELGGRLPEHEAALAAIRQLATERVADRDAAVQNPAIAAELEAKRGRLRFLQRAMAVRDPAYRPTVDVRVMPQSPELQGLLPWPLVSPARPVFGFEAEALEHIRRRVAQMPEPSSGRAGRLDTLAWALHANGYYQEAEVRANEALELAASLGASAFLDYNAFVRHVSSLLPLIEVDSRSQALANARTEIARLERAIELLTEEVTQRSVYRFDDVELQWRHDELAELVRALKRWNDPDPAVGMIENVGRRLAFAQDVTAASLDQPAAAWDRAIASIADPDECPKYGGLRIVPQLGLVPIGTTPDPSSGLWEFSHLQTGEVVTRGADDRLQLTPASGLVFVLLPGGSFQMGEPRGVDAFDSRASPVRRIDLEPFLISKYEMTQAQWERFTGSNPSTFAAGRTFGGHAPSALHPVETVTWHDCAEVMRRLDLVLPTEAQWEYATRAGTLDRWWTGDDLDEAFAAGETLDPQREFWSSTPGSLLNEWANGRALAHSAVDSDRANPFGLYGTIGNVWEWCRDWQGSYRLIPAPGDGERFGGVGRTRRTARGGSFMDPVQFAGSTVRNPTAPDQASYAMGLRPSKRLVR